MYLCVFFGWSGIFVAPQASRYTQVNTTATAQTGAVRSTRTEIVDRARQQWIGKLIDLSRRNNLLYFRILKTGTLDLSTAPPEQMARLLSGEGVPISKLLPSDREISASTVREIARRALSNLEEKGLGGI